MNTLDSYRGVVGRLIDGSQYIEINLPRGGKLRCRNKGFEIGEAVCFTLGPTNKVISLLPLDVAKVKMEIANNENLQIAIMEDDHAGTIEYDDTSNGYPYEGSIDPCCQEHRENDIRREDYPELPAGIENGDWSHGNYEDRDGEPRETYDGILRVFPGQGEIPIMGEWDEFVKGRSHEFYDERDPDNYPIWI